MRIDLYPAIDLRDGKVVRLHKGDFGAETIYGDNAIEVARSFAHAGAPWIHVVDLDAARTGNAKNRVLIGAIAQAVDVPVQAGGGVRDKDSARALLETGVTRIVVGTAAIEQPGLVEWLANRAPGRIAVGVDARGDEVAVRGWQAGGNTKVTDLVRRFNGTGVGAFVVTNIDRDGTLEGPDTVGLAEVLRLTEIDVIASGGIGSMDDIKALSELMVSGYRHLAGIITGKAIYEGHIDVSEAVSLLKGME